jgi:hypothetical protein
MIGQFGGNLRRDAFLPAMHGTNDLQKFRVYASLQQVSPCAGLQCPEDLDVACIGSQDNDPGIREFSTNGDDCFDTPHIRHL